MQDGPHDITGWTVLNPHLSCWCSHYLLKAPENTVIFSMFHDVSWVYPIRSPTYLRKFLLLQTSRSWIPLPHVATLQHFSAKNWRHLAVKTWRSRKSRELKGWRLRIDHLLFHVAGHTRKSQTVLYNFGGFIEVYCTRLIWQKMPW